MGKNVIEALGDIAGHSIHNEALALVGSAISAGHLVEETASGVQEHSTAAASAQKLVALTNLCNGGSITDAYAVGETVRYGAFSSGQECYLRLAAGASAVVVGDTLESAGDGTIRKQATAAATANTARNSVVAYAIESIDNSGGGAEVFIKVRMA